MPLPEYLFRIELFQIKILKLDKEIRFAGNGSDIGYLLLTFESFMSKNRSLLRYISGRKQE